MTPSSSRRAAGSLAKAKAPSEVTVWTSGLIPGIAREPEDPVPDVEQRERVHAPQAIEGPDAPQGGQPEEGLGVAPGLEAGAARRGLDLRPEGCAQGRVLVELAVVDEDPAPAGADHGLGRAGAPGSRTARRCVRAARRPRHARRGRRGLGGRGARERVRRRSAAPPPWLRASPTEQATHAVAIGLPGPGVDSRKGSLAAGAGALDPSASAPWLSRAAAGRPRRCGSPGRARGSRRGPGRGR